MFTYFLANYAWNLAVSLSIGMGAELSETEAACLPLLGLGDQAQQGEGPRARPGSRTGATERAATR